MFTSGSPARLVEHGVVRRFRGRGLKRKRHRHHWRICPARCTARSEAAAAHAQLWQSEAFRVAGTVNKRAAPNSPVIADPLLSASDAGPTLRARTHSP